MIDRADRRRAAWLSPVRVALAGAALVVLLLTLPIRTAGPGDHEKLSCGNTLSLDLRPWQVGARAEARDHWERAHRACTGQRVDRLAQAVGVVSLTGLVVTALATAPRRRGAADKPRD